MIPEQLRGSVFVDGPCGHEVDVCDQIPRFVPGDPGTLTLQVGPACIVFSDVSALIATARLAELPMPPTAFDNAQV